MRGLSRRGVIGCAFAAAGFAPASRVEPELVVLEPPEERLEGAGLDAGLGAEGSGGLAGGGGAEDLVAGVLEGGGGGVEGGGLAGAGDPDDERRRAG